MSVWNVEHAFPVADPAGEASGVEPGIFGGTREGPAVPLVLGTGVTDANDTFGAGTYPVPSAQANSLGACVLAGAVLIDFDTAATTSAGITVATLGAGVAKPAKVQAGDVAVFGTPSNFATFWPISAQQSVLPAGVVALNIGTGQAEAADDWATLLAGHSLFLALTMLYTV